VAGRAGGPYLHARSHTLHRVLLYVGSLVRNHLQTCSNCSPRTLESGSRRANTSLNAPTAGMLIDAYDVERRSRKRAIPVFIDPHPAPVKEGSARPPSRHGIASAHLMRPSKPGNAVCHIR
jgi:hypothetical protein